MNILEFVFKNLLEVAGSLHSADVGKRLQLAVIYGGQCVPWCWREFLFFPWQRPHFEVTSCMCVTELVSAEELFQNNIMLPIYTYVCVIYYPYLED